MTRIKIDRKDKKLHREFVWLAASEYAHLCDLLGKEALERWIDELNLHLGSKGDKYKSHYYTIQVWAKREAAKTAGSGVQASGSRIVEANRAAGLVIEALKRRRA